jgi:uncharacterized membrane protein
VHAAEDDHVGARVGRLLGQAEGVTDEVTDFLDVINTGSPNFFVAASVTLVLGLIFQVALMTGYLLIRDRKTLVALFQAWRPSMTAGFMGAFASQMWFLAFALESAAKIRTLGLVEILFAQLLSRRAFQQGLASREAIGIGLIIIGVILLLNT